MFSLSRALRPTTRALQVSYYTYDGIKKVFVCYEQTNVVMLGWCAMHDSKNASSKLATMSYLDYISSI